MRKGILLGGLALGFAFLGVTTSCDAFYKGADECFIPSTGIYQLAYEDVDVVSIPLVFKSYSSSDTNGEYVHKFKFKETISANDIVLKGAVEGKTIAGVEYEDEYSIRVVITGATKSKTDKCGAIAVTETGLLDDFEQVKSNTYYYMRVLAGEKTDVVPWSEWPTDFDVVGLF